MKREIDILIQCMNKYWILNKLLNIKKKKHKHWIFLIPHLYSSSPTPVSSSSIIKRLPSISRLWGNPDTKLMPCTETGKLFVLRAIFCPGINYQLLEDWRYIIYRIYNLDITWMTQCRPRQQSSGVDGRLNHEIIVMLSAKFC